MNVGRAVSRERRRASPGGAQARNFRRKLPRGLRSPREGIKGGVRGGKTAERLSLPRLDGCFQTTAPHQTYPYGEQSLEKSGSFWGMQWADAPFRARSTPPGLCRGSGIFRHGTREAAATTANRHPASDDPKGKQVRQHSHFQRGHDRSEFRHLASDDLKRFATLRKKAAYI